MLGYNFQSSLEAEKSFMKKIMRLILYEVIMSYRHMSDEKHWEN